jgi:hypothetical protein
MVSDTLPAFKKQLLFLVFTSILVSKTGKRGATIHFSFLLAHRRCFIIEADG